MKEKIEITASIVLYNEDLNELRATIKSFLEVPLNKKLYLIDNTPQKKFDNLFLHKDIEYIGVGKNIGFGAGQNIVIKKIANESKYNLLDMSVSYMFMTRNNDLYVLIVLCANPIFP